MKYAVDPQFWRGKRVFLTGHTGFKGSWLSLWLQQMGAELSGYALAPEGETSLFDVAKVGAGMRSTLADIRDPERLGQAVEEADPEILIHMAAQPLVRHSYADPVGTYQTNVIGTVNVLEAARNAPSLRAIVNVTTDKCYENREWAWGYRENEPMGGHDPYSSSKGCAELVTSAYRSSFFEPEGRVGLASARAGNVIGGGDWAKDRIVPDALTAFSSGEALVIRSPRATRPWQHVLEPLSGYIILAQALWEDRGFSEGWNFGPRDEDALPVEAIVRSLSAAWGPEAHWRVDDNGQHPHEANFLKLDISKAATRLGWRPAWAIGETLRRIAIWHRAWLNGDDMQARCLAEIADYSAARAGNDPLSTAH